MSEEPQFSAAQMAQLSELIRKVVSEELGNSGLRLDGQDHADENRKDFQFTRSLRIAVNSAASRVGLAVIMLVLGGFGWLITHGFEWWRAAS